MIWWDKCFKIYTLSDNVFFFSAFIYQYFWWVKTDTGTYKEMKVSRPPKIRTKPLFYIFFFLFCFLSSTLFHLSLLLQSLFRTFFKTKINSNVVLTCMDYTSHFSFYGSFWKAFHWQVHAEHSPYIPHI